MFKRTSKRGREEVSEMKRKPRSLAISCRECELYENNRCKGQGKDIHEPRKKNC
jgi:hypothetical protein